MDIKLFGYIITAHIGKARAFPKPLSKEGQKIARRLGDRKKLGRVRGVFQHAKHLGYSREEFGLVDARDWVVAAYHDKGCGAAR